MPWDNQHSNTNNILFITGDSAKKTSTVFETRIDKFPLALWRVEEAPTSGTTTYTVGFEYSIDNENWVTLYSISGRNNGSQLVVDLSNINNKPDGAIYLRGFATPNQAIPSLNAGSVVFQYSWWVDNTENSYGVRAV